MSGGFKTLTLSGMKDGVLNNAKMIYGQQEYDMSESNTLNDAVNAEHGVSDYFVVLYKDGIRWGLTNLFFSPYEEADIIDSSINGTYVWFKTDPVERDIIFK